MEQHGSDQPNSDPTHLSTPPEREVVRGAPPSSETPPPEQDSEAPGQPILAEQPPQVDIRSVGDHAPAGVRPGEPLQLAGLGTVIPVIVVHSVDPSFLHRLRQPERRYSPRPYPQALTVDVGNFYFDDRSVRQAFIRKVYFILTIQLLVTFGAISLFTFHTPTKQFVRRNRPIWWISLIVVFVTIIAMSCFPGVRRKYPVNFLFLFVFTAAMSFLLGTIASVFEGDAVLMAVGVTAAVCFALSIFAFQIKWDFTVLRGALMAGLVILLIFGIVIMFFPGRTAILIYASLGAFIFCLQLVVDTQMIIGGKHRYSISPEEYIFAALTLYLDIVNIFLMILMITSIVRR